MALVVAALIAPTAHAATFNIPCGDTAALNSAITSANTTATPDTIELAPCTYTVTTPAVVSNGNNYAVPIVTQPLTINGNGATLERSSSAATPFRILGTVNTLTVNDLTIKGGTLTANGQGGGGIVALLGATQTLTLNRDVITGNVTNGTSSSGGGVGQIGGNLVINNTKFTGNSSKLDGGAIFAQNAATTIVNSVFGDGTQAGANASGLGGALYTAGGTLDVTHSFFWGNIALAGGGTYTVSTNGTIRRSSYVLNLADNTGGAVVQGGTMNFENDTFGLNTAGWFGISNPNNIGGIAVTGNGATPGVANVSSSTFADSGRTTSTAPGASLVTITGGTINVTDTIVTDTNSSDPTPPTGTGNYKQCDTSLGGTINNQGGNIQWPQNTCGFGTVADPQLKPIDAATLTYGLEPTSPAIDLGGTTGPAVDELGNPRPSGEGFDAGAVEAQIPQTTVDPVPSPTNSPVINAHSDIPGSTFECSVDGKPFEPCAAKIKLKVKARKHNLQVRATDPAGNTDPTPASPCFTVEGGAPPPRPVITATIPSSPANNNSPKVKGTLPSGGTLSNVKIYTNGNCSGTPAANRTPEKFTGSGIAISVPDNATTTFTATVRLNGATTPCSDPFTYVEDSTAPETTITSAPAPITDDPTPTFAFSSAEALSSFECRVDAAAFSPCSGPGGQHTTEPLMDGPHTFEVRATDRAGNLDASPAAATFTINTAPADTDPPDTDQPDTAAPETTITKGPAKKITKRKVTFTFASSEAPAAFECKLDKAEFAACVSGLRIKVKPGRHTFEVRAKDGAGNVDQTPARVRFKVKHR